MRILRPANGGTFGAGPADERNGGDQRRSNGLGRDQGRCARGRPGAAGSKHHAGIGFDRSGPAD